MFTRQNILAIIRQHLTSKSILNSIDHTSNGQEVVRVGVYTLSPLVEVYDTETGNHIQVTIEDLAKTLIDDNPIGY